MPQAAEIAAEIVAEPVIFDHERLRPLAAYQALLRALGALQGAVPGLGLSEVGQIAREAACGLSCAEPCPRCSIPAALRWAAPWRIEAAARAGELVARYRCPRCAAGWTSAYVPELDEDDAPRTPMATDGLSGVAGDERAAHGSAASHDRSVEGAQP